LLAENSLDVGKTVGIVVGVVGGVAALVGLGLLTAWIAYRQKKKANAQHVVLSS
jgi:hypothetical protein